MIMGVLLGLLSGWQRAETDRWFVTLNGSLGIAAGDFSHYMKKGMLGFEVNGGRRLFGSPLYLGLSVSFYLFGKGHFRNSPYQLDGDNSWPEHTYTLPNISLLLRWVPLQTRSYNGYVEALAGISQFYIHHREEHDYYSGDDYTHTDDPISNAFFAPGIGLGFQWLIGHTRTKYLDKPWQPIALEFGIRYIAGGACEYAFVPSIYQAGFNSTAAATTRLRTDYLQTRLGLAFYF